MNMHNIYGIILNIKTMGEYHDLYLQLDVLLLADVMNKFRQSCMEHYKLDPSHFYTLPKFFMECHVKNDKCKN